MRPTMVDINLPEEGRQTACAARGDGFSAAPAQKCAPRWRSRLADRKTDQRYGRVTVSSVRYLLSADRELCYGLEYARGGQKGYGLEYRRILKSYGLGYDMLWS